ncbi:protoglobin domain-containing protein [Bacillus sp. 31A1R]|uniref:Protoglobin domain-containing protein n=1 Tax=Robertmurraya mangrovi TaxID=3098077 RepID=A0ABU5J3N8_9BACI|nr:protoglobin domain-containing protein [Bacillus sp. 31A1R]MDZ5473972.1 protoglobin domain-containing protein [Bacillus sp. 31A1R]
MNKRMVFSERETCNQDGCYIDPSLPADILIQLMLIHLDEQDLQLINRLSPLMKDDIFYIVEEYVNQLAISDSKSLQHINEFKNFLRSHIYELFSGRIDTDFINSRKKLALYHQKFGLELAGYFKCIAELFKYIFEKGNIIKLNDTNPSHLPRAITRIISFELMLVHLYMEKHSSLVS